MMFGAVFSQLAADVLSLPSSSLPIVLVGFRLLCPHRRPRRRIHLPLCPAPRTYLILYRFVVEGVSKSLTAAALLGLRPY